MQIKGHVDEDAVDKVDNVAVAMHKELVSGSRGLQIWSRRRCTQGRRKAGSELADLRCIEAGSEDGEAG